MTAGLSSAPACVRVIIRDVAGKHSWDSAVLYGPPPCSPNSPAQTLLTQTQSPHSANLQLRTPPGGPPTKDVRSDGVQEAQQEERESEEEEQGMEGDGFQRKGDEGGEERNISDEEKSDQRGAGEGKEEEQEEQLEEEHKSDGERDRREAVLEQHLAPPLAKRVCREAVPRWDSMREGDDALDEMLQYLGHSSSECLQRTGTYIQHLMFVSRPRAVLIIHPYTSVFCLFEGRYTYV